MDKWGFDGLDLDYEHPHAAEKAGFANWIKELRNVFGSKYEVVYVPLHKHITSLCYVERTHILLVKAMKTTND